MKRLHSAIKSGSLRWLAPCVMLALASSACAKKDSKDEEAAEATKTAPESEPAPPLDRSYLPTAALTALEQLELDSQPPCSLTIDTLRPALQGLADGRRALDAAEDKAAAVTLLSDLSAALGKQAATLATRNESDELRRISAELTATIGDLAESLQLASNALSADDKPQAAANLRRIQNGVDNTRSTIDALIQQCP